MSAKDVKISLFEVAAKIVAPIVATAAVKSQFTIDPTVQDAALRQLNLFAFEEMQVIYDALVLAYQNNEASAWPDPVVAIATPTPAVSGTVPSPGANLANIASTIAGVAGAIAPVIAAGS